MRRTRVIFILLLGIMLVAGLACGGGNSDKTPPVISSISATDITEISTVISWLTNKPASSKIIYSLQTDGDDLSITDDRLSYTHSVELKWLQPDASYIYQIYSQDMDGNEAVSEEKIVHTKAFPEDRAILIGTVLFGDKTPAYNVFVYIFKEEDLCGFDFVTTDEEGLYTFFNLPFGHYEIYSSNMQLGEPHEYSSCVEKDLYRAFIRPPETVNINKNQLIIAPTRTHFKDINIHYQKEYIDTNQPEISWDPVPTAAYYKIILWASYWNEPGHKEYREEITVLNTSIVWPTQLVEMWYDVSVYAYADNDIYLADNVFESFRVGHAETVQ